MVFCSGPRCPIRLVKPESPARRATYFLELVYLGDFTLSTLPHIMDASS